MQTKLFLTLIALNGLFWGIDSTNANATSIINGDRQITTLSHDIAKLLNLDPDDYSLVQVAIDRALIAQTLGDCKNPATTNTDPNSPNNPKTTPNKTTKPPIQTIGQSKNKVATPEEPPIRRRFTMGARG